MASFEMVNVLEHCRLAPAPGTVDEKSLPLTFFDIPWLHFPLIQHLFFYEFPYPKSHFIDTIIPLLKHSLSLALKHFYPFAGKLIFPPNFGKPEIRYVSGDAVSLVFAESNKDFNHITGNHQRNVAEFHSLVAQLPPVSIISDLLVAPLLAVQVTLFPNSGICIGFTFRRVTADGNACTRFIRSWASINKVGRETTMVESGSQRQLSTNKVIATFILGQSHVQQLKKWVLSQCPTSSHVSTFTVTCAYVWTCMVKARERSGEKVTEDEFEHFVFGADCRALLQPPLPATYFVAAKTIGEAIQERLRKKEGVLKDAEKWISEFETRKEDRIVGVAGSPRFAVYDIDFGLGKPKKSEVVSIDMTGSISLNECKNDKESFEIGLSLPKIKMDAFEDIFANGFQV
ncbi:Malonyl-coenzyme A:anthocyanin 3-O-glucoside-6''-O-malonyltransferase [Vitis vinifera]|uniref:Malonyl-coenzyme A:anthocyanin 3-O-glucoside-6''-O-malonyltransferase n=1 Tax=Vitis vinifera TaxID=29760 RepID=A0A438GF72_VITVI|nr:Malonyl-coenzyme A:anthocyanin 3-O-glucoside-6''-O-malonyltransferase [Vitis vinifera]